MDYLVPDTVGLAFRSLFAIPVASASVIAAKWILWAR